MKYSEAKKAIEALSSKYDVSMGYGDFNLVYQGITVAVYVDGYKQYKLDVYNKEFFSKLPFSNKLYMIMAELAMTPLDERVDDKKYRVMAFGEYLNLNVITSDTFLSDKNDTEDFKTKFTIKEIDNFKQRDDIPLDWNKVILEEANEN